MTVGNITVESGKYKAVFNFVNEKFTIRTEPHIDLDTTEKSEEQIFVVNMTEFIANCLMNGIDK